MSVLIMWEPNEPEEPRVVRESRPIRVERTMGCDDLQRFQEQLARRREQLRIWTMLLALWSLVLLAALWWVVAGGSAQVVKGGLP